MQKRIYSGFLLSAFFLFASGFTQLVSADLSRLLCELDEVPGLPGIEIRSINPAAIGPEGQVLAGIVYWDEEFFSRSMVAYIEKPGDPPQKIIGYNESVPGAPGTFSSLSTGRTAVAASGLVMFNALFDAGPADARNTLVTGQPGNLQASIFQKQEIPEIGAGFEVQAFVPKMNQSGQVAYWVELRRLDPFERVYALFSGSPRAETLLYRTGATYPGLPLESTLTDIDDIWFNNDGLLAFSGEVTVGSTRLRGIWTGSGGSLKQITLAGENASAANLPGGDTWSLPHRILSIADNGWLAFQSGTSGRQGGIFIAEGNSLTRVLSDESFSAGIAPGTGGAEFDLDFRTSSGFQKLTVFQVSSSGRAVMKALLEDGTGAPAAHASNNIGVWVWDGSELSLYIRLGDPAPGFEAPSQLRSITSISIGSDNRIIIGGDIGGINTVIWGEVEPGSLSVISKNGTSIEMPEGIVVGVSYSSLSDTTPSNGADGSAMRVNAKGQILLKIAEGVDPFRQCIAHGLLF